MTTTPPGTCLSADANFTAVDGQGIFLGSICEAIAAVTLQFDAVSAVSGSPLTPDVTGSVEINSKCGYNQSVKLSRQSLFSLMQ